ncbi:MAG TPA: LacI family transcriptional regulator [Lachnospiraceae bacterium]|nr:LacI family transcriptional regulator [Lachnospiraceae bacterium]
MSITAKELAKKLGISAAAVSMALNNKPGVSRDTRQMILDAAEREGYDFSRLSAKNGPGGNIYFVIYKKHGAVVADTPFFSQLSDGISVSCKENGYKMNIRYVYDDEDTIKKQVEDIQYSDCCGIILLGTEMGMEDFRIFQSLPLPVVLLDTYFETVQADYVLINNVQGAYLATSYLIKRTRQQPGYLCSSYTIGNFRERAAGFYSAVRASGMPASKSIVHRLSPSVEGAFSDMMEILEQKEELARCYFADNDLIAVGAMRALKVKGYHIPEDIAVAGFDNITFSNIVEPSLTTIHVPKEEMGRIAAGRLIQLIEKKQMAPVKIEISTRLIKRHSA